MRDAVEAAAKEASVGFTKAVKTVVEEDISKVRSKSELCRRRGVKKSARVAEDNDRRRRAQEE